MNFRIARAVLVGLALSFVGPTIAAEPAFSTDGTTIGQLLDNAQTRGVLEKYAPNLVHSDRIGEARGMTLRALQPFTPKITDDLLASIDLELAKIVPASDTK